MSDMKSDFLWAGYFIQPDSQPDMLYSIVFSIGNYIFNLTISKFLVLAILKWSDFDIIPTYKD